MQAGPKFVSDGYVSLFAKYNVTVVDTSTLNSVCAKSIKNIIVSVILVMIKRECHGTLHKRR